MKKLIRKKLTILVNSCDAYSDVWPFFFSALNEYWPNRTIELVVNTENKQELGFNNPDTIIHNSSSKFWGERLVETLDDIQTDYIVMLYDDFIIEEFFDETILNDIIEWMEGDPNISAFYLDNLKLKKTLNNNSFDKFEQIDPRADFRLNSAPGVWRKKDLQLFTGKEDSPWAWEVFGTYRTQRTIKKFYQSNNKIYSFNGSKGGAIYRGKWVKEVVVDKAEKYKLNIDFNIRGFSSDTEFEKRTLSWKINFILLGYKMVGFDVLKFIRNALISKLVKMFRFKHAL